MIRISLLFLLVLAFVSGIKSFNPADYSPPTEEPLLMAQNQGKYKCMEECAKSQYQCEQQNKDKPGTKADNEWSAKCQERYRACLDKCK
jgi:hypothetical protein